MNYQKELEKLILELQTGEYIPSLLLHSCCAPCSSYVLEYLSRYFKITVYFYNPNIFPAAEYQKRLEEQKHLIERMPQKNRICFMGCEYHPEGFLALSEGLEQMPEGGERCFRCYRLRLEATAKEAATGGYDFYSTTLTISPLKKAEKLNEIGNALGRIYSVRYLPSDFKKNGGYQRSVELSKEYQLYRQNFCGCVYSHQIFSSENNKIRE